MEGSATPHFAPQHKKKHQKKKGGMSEEEVNDGYRSSEDEDYVPDEASTKPKAKKAKRGSKAYVCLVFRLAWFSVPLTHAHRHSHSLT